MTGVHHYNMAATSENPGFWYCGSSSIPTLKLLAGTNRFQTLQRTGASAENAGKTWENLESFSRKRNSLVKHIDYLEFFRALDLDFSGYITPAKLGHVMTSFGMPTNDGLLDEMISNFDEDGDGKVTFPEFMKKLSTITSLANTLEMVEVSQTRSVDHADLFNRLQDSKEVRENHRCEEMEEHVDDAITLDQMPHDLKHVLEPFDLAKESKVNISDLKRAAELLRAERFPPYRPEDNPFLHWSKDREKNGLAGFVYKANHVALIVKDVGRSAAFYANVLGFEQIRRPNFDRHGAWFTMGNLELHLIKGTPIVPSGDDLIVGHISIEANNIDQVPDTLRKLGVPFQQNVSVPRSVDAGQGTNESNTSDKIVKQYFIRDPDGYYVEICNCDELTNYCLGSRKGGAEPKFLEKKDTARLQLLLRTWAGSAEERRIERVKVLNDARKSGGSVQALAHFLGYGQTDKVADESKLKNLLIRRTVYGDVCQNETEQSLAEVLFWSDNDMPRASHLMKLKALVEGTRKLRPPPFYENGKKKIIPPAIVTVSEF